MRYQPNMQSIRRHAAPAWYEDAKLGIFIHWGIYSVPAFAPPTWALGDVPADENWFTNNPYAEWYLNSLRIGRGPTYEYHLQKYGADFTYEDFVDLWKAGDYQGMADLVASTADPGPVGTGPAREEWEAAQEPDDE